MLYDTLSKALDIKSGKIQPIEQINAPYAEQIILDAAWKGGVHFIVSDLPYNRYGCYYVMRDGQMLSSRHFFTKTDDTLLKRMQRMIDDIENGKYKNKKTHKEKLAIIVEQRQLVSYMNNTKWRELIGALKTDIPKITIRYKRLADYEDELPEGYWSPHDEELDYMDRAEIEWFKIRHIITETEHIGRLLPPKVTEYDKKDELLQIFHKYNIPYEYDESEQAFVVYGYK